MRVYGVHRRTESDRENPSSVTIEIIKTTYKGLSCGSILFESNILHYSVLIMCPSHVDLRRKLVDGASYGSGTVGPEQQRVLRSTARIESMVPRTHYLLNNNQLANSRSPVLNLVSDFQNIHIASKVDECVMFPASQRLGMRFAPHKSTNHVERIDVPAVSPPNPSRVGYAQHALFQLYRA